MSFKSIFDSDVFKDYLKKYIPSKNKLQDEDRRRIDACLACPDPTPADFDGTLEAWFLRISIWGGIKITRKDPETRTTKEVSRDQCLDYMDKQNLNSQRGKWTIERTDVNKIRFYRKFYTINGKDEEEEILVTIDLRDDLKTILKKFK